MSTVSRGFRGRGRRPSAELPPGQYLVEDFPVLSAGPTPSIDLGDWELTITSETGEQYQAPRSWTERAYPNLIYYNQVDRGGHFAAWEQPDLFAAEMRAAFRSLR